jgi:exosortase
MVVNPAAGIHTVRFFWRWRAAGRNSGTWLDPANFVGTCRGILAVPQNQEEEVVMATAQLAPVSAASVSGHRGFSGWQAGVLFLLTAWLYAPIVSRLAVQWWQDPNYVHGFFVPAFSLLLLWEDRARLIALPLKPSWPGLVILLFALFALTVGVLSSQFFLPRISLLLLISGMVVFLAGWEYLRAVSFPLAFLILMVPSSDIFHRVTFPLQILASKTATFLLTLAGVSVVREGNILLLSGARMQVAEACSGIQSLFSLVTLAIVYGYLIETKIGMRILLALAAVPISILANAFRIFATGIVLQHWGIERAQGSFHALSGWLIFMTSLVMLFLFHCLLRSLCPMPESGNHGEGV